jgi:hypothetical protein
MKKFLFVLNIFGFFISVQVLKAFGIDATIPANKTKQTHVTNQSKRDIG